MAYVIFNGETRKYVAPPGQERSYANRLQDAWVLETRSEAEHQRCGNELVLEKQEA